jgi:hypothetical protein
VHQFAELVRIGKIAEETSCRWKSQPTDATRLKESVPSLMADALPGPAGSGLDACRLNASLPKAWA